MRANLTNYRGYCIDVFGKDTRWHYSASPRSPDLPILNHNVFALDTESKGLALADARLRIDCLLRMA